MELSVPFSFLFMSWHIWFIDNLQDDHVLSKFFVLKDCCIKAKRRNLICIWFEAFTKNLLKTKVETPWYKHLADFAMIRFKMLSIKNNNSERIGLEGWKFNKCRLIFYLLLNFLILEASNLVFFVGLIGSTIPFFSSSLDHKALASSRAYLLTLVGLPMSSKLFPSGNSCWNKKVV